MANKEVDNSSAFSPLPKSSCDHMCPQRTEYLSYNTVPPNYPRLEDDDGRYVLCYSITEEDERRRGKFTDKKALPGCSSDKGSMLQTVEANLQDDVLSQRKICKIVESSPKPSTSKFDIPVFSSSKETSDYRILRPTLEKLMSPRKGSMKETALQVNKLNKRKDIPRNHDRKTFEFSSKPSTSKSCVPDDVCLKSESEICVHFPPSMMEFKPLEISSYTKLQVAHPHVEGDRKGQQKVCKILENSPKSGTSISDIPLVHYSKESSDCRIFLPTKEKLVPPTKSYKQGTVLQVDIPDLEKDSPHTQYSRTFRYSSGPSTSKGLVPGVVCCLKKESDTLALLRPEKEELGQMETTFSCPVAEAASRGFESSDVPEDLTTGRSEPAQQVQYSKMQWTFIGLAWLTTAVGLGVYIYLLVLGFSGHYQIFKEKSTFVVVCLISSVCLLTGVYFNYKIKKYFLN